MSEARRTAEALTAARETVKAAAIAAGKHSHRGPSSSWPQHINDLFNLAMAMEVAHYLITQSLATVVKSCADDVRTHYVHGFTPDSKPWPDNIKRAAGEADEALSMLSRNLKQISVWGSHNALASLRELIRNLRHDNKPK